MKSQPSVSEIIDSFACLDELEGFVGMVRQPPTGVPVRHVTEDEWQQIAQKRIQLTDRATKRKGRKG